jgi:hypothetical protein
MKSIMALALVALLSGCAPVYYAPYAPVGYAPQPVYAPPVVQMYAPAPPVYVPTCRLVDRWDPVYYAWRRTQVCS